MGNIEVSSVAKLPTIHGEFLVKAYKDNTKEHLVIYTPDLPSVPLVRIHSECLTGDALGSLRCDCRDQLNYALDLIAKEKGMVIYLRQEGRDIGLLNKINAYSLQDIGLDTVEANHQLGFEADLRDYSIVEYILNDFGIKQIRLLTNNPKKISSLKGVEILSREPIVIKPNNYNKRYLATKVQKLGHLLEGV